jgi:hypothetical protein
MTWWVALTLALSALCSGVPYLYARKIASEGREGDAKPIWFGGIANVYLVTNVLSKRSKQGDKWAGRACFLYCVGAAIPPVLIGGLVIRDYLTRG